MKKTVLLVEDDDDLRRSTQEIIELDGTYTVIALPNGKEALDYLATAETPPDITILDEMMYIRGSEVALTLSRLGMNAILISGCAEDAVRSLQEKGLKYPVLKKPFDDYKLLKMIDSLTATDLEQDKEKKKSVRSVA